MVQFLRLWIKSGTKKTSGPFFVVNDIFTFNLFTSLNRQREWRAILSGFNLNLCQSKPTTFWKMILQFLKDLSCLSTLVFCQQSLSQIEKDVVPHCDIQILDF